MRRFRALLPVLALLLSMHAANAQNVYYTETFEGDSFGSAAAWYGYWNTTAQPGQTGSTYNQSITSGGSWTGAGNYTYAQTTGSGGSMNYLLFSQGGVSINPADFSTDDGLYVIWDKFGSSPTYHFTIEVDGNWYASSNTYTSGPTGTTPFNLLTAEWHALTVTPNSDLSIDTNPANVLGYDDLFGSGDSITDIGFYVTNLGAGGTVRFNNIEIYNNDVDRYYWQGAAGTGGNGTWNTLNDTMWDGLWRSHRMAVFGGPNDVGEGGIVTLNNSQTMGAAGLRFEELSDGYVLQAASSSPSKTLALTGHIYIHENATVTFGNDLIVTRSDSNLNIDGGGTLVIENGARVQSTLARFLSIHNDSTVEVNTGGQFTATNSIIIGSTVAGGTSGAARLVVNGGVVSTTHTSNGGNFILGNRDSVAGDVEVTIHDGEINVNPTAANGLVFENTKASNAYFNLNGGVVTTRHVRRNGNAPSSGYVSQFNFNGGVLRVDAVGVPSTDTTPGDADNPNYAFLHNHSSIAYRILQGGAIIDTNGRNILIAAPLVNGLEGGADGGFTKRGDGILQLRGINTYNGKTVIEQGTLNILENANLGADAGGIEIYDDATLLLAGGMDLSSRAISVGNAEGGGTGTIEVAADEIVTYGGDISDNDNAAFGSLNKTGDGTLALSGANSYQGKTTISEGVLKLSDSGFFGTGSLASPWIETRQNAVFDVADLNLLTMLPYNAGSNTFSGNGIYRGDYTFGSGSKLKVGATSGGNQGLANIASAGDLIGVLTFDGNLNLEGAEVHFQIGGATEDAYDQLVITGEFSANDQTSFLVTWANGFTASGGQIFDLIDWMELGDFSADPDLANLILPDLDGILYWDTSDFLTDGIVRVVPEPSRALLLCLTLGLLIIRRKRF